MTVETTSESKLFSSDRTSQFSTVSNSHEGKVINWKKIIAKASEALE
jgi:hypothetical protein